MASLLKNQILKHISKFSKNLSPDKINLSTLKGEGELCNLELDEKILTQLLDLPTWLQITKASVNRVTVKIQWTRLKSQPIFLMLDKVVVETETCETPRPPNDPAHLASYRSGGKYGFTDRVIDGIYVHVESVEVKLVSKAFHASLQLLRLKVQSTTPTWQPTNDLRQTRLRDTDRDEIILFKEIEWQNVKIEANGIESTTNPDFLSTPLRLLANMSKIRITVKKKLSDCSIIASRVVLLIDDLLWVLTATQLKAAILYSNSLSEVIERSAKQSKTLAAEKLKQQYHSDTSANKQTHQQEKPPSAALFNKYDVLTTSYHLITSRIDLHLCDDGTSDTAPPPERTWNVENGALQVTMFKLSVDYYPFHPAGGERKQWFRYADNIGSRNPWVQQLFNAFRSEAVAARKACGITSPPMPHQQKSPQRSASPQPTRSPRMSPSHYHKEAAGSPSHASGSQYGSSTHLARPKSTRLLESCVVLKLEDFTIYMVSTPQNQRSGHHKFFASDKKQLHLPADMSVLHLEYTEYFFPDELGAPVPHANLYALLNPVRLTFDNLTLIWFNFFMLNLSLSLEYDLQKRKSIEHVDVKFEALMPRVLLPAETKVEGQPDRPEYLQIQISKACISNTRVEEKLKSQDLQNVLDSYKDNDLIKSTSFPNDTQYTSLPSIFYDHALDEDNPYIDKKAKWLVMQGQHPDLDPHVSADASCLSTNTLKKEAICDVWGIALDQVWLEFLGALNSRSRPQPFVEAVPLTLWFTVAGKRCSNNKSKSVTNTTKNLNTENANATRENGEGSCSYDKRPTKLLLKQFYSKERCSNAEENCDSTENDSTSSDSNDSDRQTRKNSDEENLADFYVIAKIGAKLRIQLNHFQYLFILRLSESLLRFFEQLTADFQMLGIEGSSSFVFPLTIPQVEIAAQCPCLMNLKCFPDDLSAPVSPSENQGAGFSPPEFSNVQFAEVIEDVCQEEVEIKISPSEEYVPNVVITKSLSDPTIQSHFNHPVILTSDCSPSQELNRNQQLGLNQTSMSTITLSDSNTEEQDFSVSSNSVGMDSGIGMDSRRGGRDSKMLKGTEMIKTFSSAFTNWTDKLKVKADGNEDSLSVSTEDLETMSIKTDISSDDDFEHLILDDTEAPAFCHDVSETASTTDTFSDMADDSSSVYAESSSTRGKEIVSVVLFKLDMVEVITETTGTSMSVGAQVAKLSTCQPGNINTEDFHAKFSGSKGFVQDDPLPTPVEHFPIKFHYFAKTSPKSEKDNVFMNVQASDISLTFKMSSLTSLADFVEDEKIPEPLPMSIDVQNLLLILEEDRPSSNPSSPGAVPIDVQIHRVTIRRGSDGVFHLCGASMDSFQTLLGMSSLQPMTSLRNSLDTSRTISVGKNSDEDVDHDLRRSMTDMAIVPLRQLQTDNAVLKSEISKLQHTHSSCDSKIESLKNENDKLKVQIELLRESKGANCNELRMENYSLRQKLQAMEEDHKNAEEEKKSLLATLRLLQDDLMKSEIRFRTQSK